jgi:hypothetical protein
MAARVSDVQRMPTGTFGRLGWGFAISDDDNRLALHVVFSTELTADNARTKIIDALAGAITTMKVT